MAGREAAGGPLRPDVVRGLREMAGEDGFALIAREFLSSSRRLIEEMDRSAAGGDAAALRRSAHSLRGSSGSLGADRMAALCVEIERALAAGAARPALQELVRGLAEEFAAVGRSLAQRDQ